MRARAPRMREAGRLNALGSFGISSVDPPIDNKGDPRHGEERFKEPGYSGPRGVAIVLRLLAVFPWVSKHSPPTPEPSLCRSRQLLTSTCIYEQAIPRGTHRYRSEIL